MKGECEDRTMKKSVRRDDSVSERQLDSSYGDVYIRYLKPTRRKIKTDKKEYVHYYIATAVPLEWRRGVKVTIEPLEEEAGEVLDEDGFEPLGIELEESVDLAVEAEKSQARNYKAVRNDILYREMMEKAHEDMLKSEKMDKRKVRCPFCGYIWMSQANYPKCPRCGSPMGTGTS